MADVIPPIREGSRKIDDLLLEAARLDGPARRKRAPQDAGDAQGHGRHRDDRHGGGVVATIGRDRSVGSPSNGWPSVRWVLRRWCPSRYSPVALPRSAPPPSLNGATPQGVFSPRETRPPLLYRYHCPTGPARRPTPPDPSPLRGHPADTASARQRTSSHPSRDDKIAAETASTEATANPSASRPGDVHPSEVAQPSATSLRNEIALLEGVQRVTRRG